MTRMNHTLIIPLTEETRATWKMFTISMRTRINAFKSMIKYMNYTITYFPYTIKTTIDLYFKNHTKHNTNPIVTHGLKTNTPEQSFNVRKVNSRCWINVSQLEKGWISINRIDIKLLTLLKTNTSEHNIMAQLNSWNMIHKTELSKTLI